MSFYEILKSGAKIRIEDRHGALDPAEFWMENGRLFTWCPEVGTWERDESFGAEKFNAHMDRMIADKMTILVLS